MYIRDFKGLKMKNGWIPTTHFTDSERLNLELKEMQDAIITLEHQIDDMRVSMNKIVEDYNAKHILVRESDYV